MREGQPTSTLYLRIDDRAVRIDLDDASLAEEARSQIVLRSRFDGELLGRISYWRDDSVNELVPKQVPLNVVHHHPIELGGGRRQMRLKMFDRFAFVIDVDGSSVDVRYPADTGEAPARLLFDDVLHIALQHLIEKLDGFILHGACVVRDGRAIAFMGTSGSGKSSTAFNLTRFGFHCYTDDAVVLTPKGNRLWVWPLTRELSIRPLTFQLFAEQGIELGDYVREGEKFYFRGFDRERGDGMPLEHICFVEVSGESHTEVTRLSPERTLELLLAERRNFSFMARPAAGVYSKVVAERVPAPLAARVGMDLDEQGRTLAGLVLGREDVEPERAARPRAAAATRPDRSHKLAQIRRAFSEPGFERLCESIPLLGDADPKVFTAAHALFQNEPLAQLEPLTHADARAAATDHSEAAWLHAGAWREGCRQLFARAGSEVLQRFAVSWTRSAPLLQPFLAEAAAADPEARGALRKAAAQYRAERYEDGRDVEVHVANFREPVAWGDPEFREWWRELRTSEPHGLRLHVWLAPGGPPAGREPGKREPWELLTEPLGGAPAPRLTVVPVGLHALGELDAAHAWTREAQRRGIEAHLSRATPLCRIQASDARDLLASKTIERAPAATPRARFFHAGAGKPLEAAQPMGPLHELRWPDASIGWRAEGALPCAGCALQSLGVCRGGFFEQGALE